MVKRTYFRVIPIHRYIMKKKKKEMKTTLFTTLKYCYRDGTSTLILNLYQGRHKVFHFG